VAKGVGHNGNAKTLGNELQQSAQSLRFLHNTHGETGGDTFLGDGINPFGPEVA
jgi:hypothetical protein